MRDADVAESADSIIETLKRAGSDKHQQRVVKAGVPAEAALGAPKAVVSKIAKQTGVAQTLAQALWESGYHEARLVAVLVADPQKITVSTLRNWATALWSWSLTDQMARYLVPKLPQPEKLLSWCATQQGTYTKRLAFAGIACCVQKRSELSDEHMDQYLQWIEAALQDTRHHVRKAVVWALIEMGKVDSKCQETAIVFAAECELRNGNAAWVGRNALKELELLVSVPERRRLLSQRSKTGRKQKE